MSDICHMTRKGNLPLDSMCSCVGMCKRSSPKYKEEAYFDPEKMEEAEITYWKETYPAQAESIGDFYKRKLVETGEKSLSWQELQEMEWGKRREELGRELSDGHPLMRPYDKEANYKELAAHCEKRIRELFTKYREADLPVSSNGLDFFDWVEKNLDYALAVRELFKKGAE